MDEEYDAIICGTGLTECMVSGLLSVKGKKVLHVDRNDYYGAEAASLNLTNLFKKFRGDQAPPPAYGSNRDWNVDLIPKFIMADGKLVKILIHTRVTRYLEWRSVNGTYVYQYQAAGMLSAAKYIHKVPATDMEALKSPLMGLLEKNRCKNFFQFVNGFKFEDRNTWQGIDPNRTTMKEVYEKFGLVNTTIDFLGHAVALYTDDSYLAMPAGPTIEKMHLYINSIARYGSSPFIYPVYGLGGLPEGFSRLSAIHGGTYMLHTPVDEILFEGGRAVGIRSGEQKATAKMVLCDPTYALASPSTQGKVRCTGKVIRSICLLKNPIPATDNCASCQIIIPQRELKRQSDIFILSVSSTHAVVPQGMFLGIISANVETSNPEQELAPAYQLLGEIVDKFVQVSDVYEPTDNGAQDLCFVSRSCDATSHFESVAEDVLSLYERITGERLDLTIPADLEEDE